LATSAHRTRPDTKRQEEQPTITRDNSNKPTREAPKICLLHKAKKKNQKKKFIKTLGDREKTKKKFEKEKFLLFGLARHLFVSRCLLPYHKIEFSLLNN